ncbi:hypothetical protein QLH51_14325 [Sphingomonas sp. 2R-10]|uniref:hypothetical protein n=1 Tax=Sphingomonas sp. 2R-10 TaxID=3045148 RepID=UPI000F78B53D|nr:hypothetical protein [Sphingomonas sp. 2R-10]MDJ0277974.1 hypothetical protein [Sphingomonas sp. 2R-10]
MRRWTMGMVVVLAGCGQADEAPPPANLIQDEPVLPAASPTPETLVTIPTRFVGTWDSDGTACDAPAPGGKRLVVAASALRMGDRDLPVRGITVADAGAVDVDVVGDRGGITEQRRYRFALGAGGSLELTGVDGPARLVRCDAPAGAEAAARNAVALNLAPDGLQTVAGASSRTLPFGTPAEVVLRVVEAATQTIPGRSTNAECGEGPLEIATYPRIAVYFQEGRFVGWSARGRGLTTMAGVGIGSKRAAVESAIVAPVEETSLGREFASGGLSGLYDAKDNVTALWAGSTCIAR